VLGGLLVTDISWRWVFYVNLPLGVLGVVFGAMFVREQRHDEPGRFDVAGFLLSGIGFGSLMYGASEGPAKGWTSAQILGSLAIGVVLLVLLVRVEMRTAHPMIDLRLLSNRLFRSCSATMVLSIAAFLGSLFLVALFYQDGFGVSALQSGLSTFPEAIGIMVGAQIAGRVYPHVGPRRLMIGGLVGVATTLALIATVSFSDSLWEMRGLMLLIGLCQAHVFVPAQAAAFATVTPAATGRASTMFNAGRQLGGAVGVAVLSTVISAVGVLHRVGGQPRPNAAAYHAAFLVAAGIALTAVAIVVRIVDEDAAPTMKPKAGSDAVAHRATPAEARVA
jgi:EmrB/QacA subfamily drug resistance transporter